MKCFTCKDERVIWHKDKYGYSKSDYCPVCFSQGKPQYVNDELKKSSKFSRNSIFKKEDTKS